VDGGVDTGPVIAQRAIELAWIDDPDVESVDPDGVLQALHPVEHELLAKVVRLFAAGSVSLDPANPRRVLLAE
jgi:phosphoribosylglycinamide formyltransferase-1